MIMKLKEPIANLLEQIAFVLEQLHPDQYTSPIKVLSNSSIGQHTRHILEFFIELEKGYCSNIVDYDKRVRNRQIETDMAFTIITIQQIIAGIDKPDKEILLHVEYGTDEGITQEVFTNYYRELVYNVEHMVHHMALIRIGVEAITNIGIPAEFGIAASTLKYRKTCAQ